MEVHCAWCEKEGKPSLIHPGDGPGGPVSHGICASHQEILLKEIDKMALKRGKNPRRRRVSRRL